MHELDRDRVLSPLRATLSQALSAVDGARGGDEAWERLEARGLIPSGTVGDRARQFGGWMISYDGKRTWNAVEREPAGNVFARRVVTNAPTPPTVGLACALASDWPGVLAAESLAREVFEALRPWMPPGAKEPPAVTWRLGVGSNGRGDTEAHCGELWFARVMLIAFSGREIEEAGEIRAELSLRAPRAVGEVCALEDAYLAKLWVDAGEEQLRQRDARDGARLLRGLPALGRAVPSEAERDGFGIATMPVDWAVVRRFNRRFSSQNLPSFVSAPNVFDALVPLWNLGYAPVLFNPGTILLEAPPINGG